jgi:hypothetical protein
MKNKDLFTMNPQLVNLKNEGVAKIRTINETDDLDLAEYELKTFVCEGEYHVGLKKMLETYIQSIDSNEQPAFWISGFYGSGKSHLAKMAGYLWSDYKFPNGNTARNIKPLPAEINDLLIEIDRKQNIYGRLTIAGTLRDFPSKDIRYSFLQILLNSLGLPAQYHHFKFFHWTKSEGIYDQLKSLVEAAGKDLKKEIENLYVSPLLAKAVLELIPTMAESEMKLRELFKAQFIRIESIGRQDFVNTIRNEILPLFYGSNIPCTIIILDELQQFIGKDPDLADNVQFLAEDLCSRFNSKFLLVGTGQNALKETPILRKLMARFNRPIEISNTDIQTVIRKTILDKRPTAVALLNDKMDKSSGEIARNLEGTDCGYVTDDKRTLVSDYPLLPSTRKFWNTVLRVSDIAGNSSQLRGQLRLIDDGLKMVADKEIGYIIPTDLIFTQNRSDFIKSGILSNDTSTLIQQRKAIGGDSEIEGRILSAIFLMNMISNENAKSDIKSNENTIADLLIDNLNTNSDTFRVKIKNLVQKLSDEKVIMPVGDEYKLQTKISSEWEQEFNKHKIKISNTGDDQIQT